MNTVAIAEAFQQIRWNMHAGYDAIRTSIDAKAEAISAKQHADFEAVRTMIFEEDFEITVPWLLGQIASKAKMSTQSLDELRLRWKEDPDDVANKVIAAVDDNPKLRNKETRKIVHAAISKQRELAADPAPAKAPEPPKLKLMSGAPMRITVRTLAELAAPVRQIITLGEGEKAQQAAIYELGLSPFGFHPAYDRHTTMALVLDNGKYELVDIGVPNIYAISRHWTHAKGTAAGSKSWAKNHWIYDAKKWNARFAQWLKGRNDTVGDTLDNLASDLIAGRHVILVSHEITGHAKEVAHEVVRRAQAGIIAPTKQPEYKVAYVGMSADHWLDDEDGPSPTTTKPKIDIKPDGTVERKVLTFTPTEDKPWFQWQRLIRLEDKPAYVLEISENWAIITYGNGKYTEQPLKDLTRWWAWREFPGGKRLPYTMQYPPSQREQTPMRAIFQRLITAHWQQYKWVYGKEKEQPVERQATLKRTIQSATTTPIMASRDEKGAYIPTSERTQIIGWHTSPPKVKLYDPDDTHHGRFDSHDQSIWEMSADERFNQVLAMGISDDDWASDLARKGETDIWTAVELADMQDHDPRDETKRDQQEARYQDALDHVLNRTRLQWYARETDRRTAERLRVEAAYIEGRMTDEDVADIAHANGYRDLTRTQDRITWSVSATMQFFGNSKGVATHIDGKPIQPREQYILSGMIYNTFPVKPEPAPTPGRRPNNGEDNATYPLYIQVLAEEVATMNARWQAIMTSDPSAAMPYVLPLLIPLLADYSKKIAFWSIMGPQLEAKLNEALAQDEAWRRHWQPTIAKYMSDRYFTAETEDEPAPQPDTRTALDIVCDAIETEMPRTMTLKQPAQIRRYWA